MPTKPRRYLGLALLAVVAVSPGCGGADTTAPLDTGEQTASVLAHLSVSGNPEGTSGATWTYRDTVAGVVYDMAGILLKPTGAGPFPAVVVSHGYGGSAGNYSRNVGTTLRSWGLVVIATNYTHASGVPLGSPGTTADLGASAANVQRARRLVEILRALGYVDTNRLAAHGHSMGAFVTVALVATHPELFRAASHTAGGVRVDGVVGAAPTESQGRAVRTPYQMHHGDQDVVVSLAADQRLDALLAEQGTMHELRIYPGYDHAEIASDATVLARMREWYGRHGVLN
ncbi:MAG TPA: dienelactone hydrolase family protein [Gemmatimonadaceae bacterium]|nr:dienelactone hydrolase family protein [Gemmatimonadaceae bacterium]